MHYIKTTNFDKFKCIAGDCPQSCCKGWQIVIDDEALLKYSKTEDGFTERLVNSIDWEEGLFLQCDGSCAMLNSDGLCDLYIARGEEALCETCDKYPRHTEEYEGIRELSLSLSCPEAARMILENKDRLEFTEWDDEEEDDFDDFDYLLYTKLEDVRNNVIFPIIQDRSITFEFKCGILTNLGKRLQAFVDEDELYEMDDFIWKLADEIKDKNYNGLSVDISWKNKELFSKLDRLEVLSPDWPETVKNTKEHWTDDIMLTKDEEVQAEQLLMFFFYVYFDGAVYDDWIYSKVMMSLLSVYWIFEIDRAKPVSELVRSAYLYAREVEHSDFNLEELETALNEELD